MNCDRNCERLCGGLLLLLKLLVVVVVEVVVLYVGVSWVYLGGYHVCAEVLRVLFLRVWKAG